MASSVFERTRALHADVEEMKEQLLNSINKHASTVRPHPDDRAFHTERMQRTIDRSCVCIRIVLLFVVLCGAGQGSHLARP